MAFALRRTSGRPSWMTPAGHEGQGDVFFDRLCPEWRRDMGEEVRPSQFTSRVEMNPAFRSELA